MVVPPNSSILVGFSIRNHPFWGTPIFGNTQIYVLKPIDPLGLPQASFDFPFGAAWGRQPLTLMEKPKKRGWEY